MYVYKQHMYAIDSSTGRRLGIAVDISGRYLAVDQTTRLCEYAYIKKTAFVEYCHNLLNTAD